MTGPESEHESAEAFYEHAPCAFLTTAPDGIVTRLNATFLDWTGYKREEVVGRRRFLQLLTPGGRLYHETHFAPLLSMHGEVKGIILDLVGPDGRVRPVLVHAVVRNGPDGRPRRVDMTLLDATDRREYERELLVARKVAERSDRRVRILHRLVAETAVAGDAATVADTLARVLSEVFDAAGAAIWLLDPGGSNLSLVAATGVPPTLCPAHLRADAPLPPAAACRGSDPVLVDSPERAGLDFPLLLAPLAESPFEGLIAVPIVAGGVTLGGYAVYFVRSRLSDSDEVELHRTLGCHAGQAIERAALYQELRHVASHDGLTDLPNRRLFDDRVEQALARSGRSGASLAVMVVDLNGFKLVNDRLGHRAGDRVLVETAHRLRHAVRPHDSVARIGGDEFAVLCEDVDAEEAEHIAGRIRDALADDIPIAGDAVSATGSIGAVVYLPRPGEPLASPAELLHDADGAMYRAKAGASNADAVSPTTLVTI